MVWSRMSADGEVPHIEMTQRFMLYALKGAAVAGSVSLLSQYLLLFKKGRFAPHTT